MEEVLKVESSGTVKQQKGGWLTCLRSKESSWPMMATSDSARKRKSQRRSPVRARERNTQLYPMSGAGRLVRKAGTKRERTPNTGQEVKGTLYAVTALHQALHQALPQSG
jgi:hypothetical protein